MTGSRSPNSIMFDMDGVLVDFVASCRRLFWQHHPKNQHIANDISSYNFWIDDWKLPEGFNLISEYAYEVFAEAPPVHAVLDFAQNLDLERFQPEIVTHLWGGEDRFLQQLSLAGKRYWLVIHGLSHIPLKPVRGTHPSKRGTYDVVIEDRPDLLLSGDLGHGKTLRVLLTNGWQHRPRPELAKQFNLVVLSRNDYELLPTVVEAYLDHGWPAAAIQKYLVDPGPR